MKRTRMGITTIVFYVMVFLILQNNISNTGNTVANNIDGIKNNQLQLKQVRQQRGYLEITSDQQLQQTAISEGWGGDGTESNPYLIENYLFEDPLLNSKTFDAVNNTFYYPFGGFSEFDIVLDQISLHVTVQNNSFTHAVLVSNSLNINILQNEWSRVAKPSNLFVAYSQRINISGNNFDGSNDHCASFPRMNFSPRVVLFTSLALVHKNLFEKDLGCLPIQQIMIDSTTGDWANPDGVTISANLFRNSDVAINARVSMTVLNNHFETGDFAILMNDRGGYYKNNNFVVSEIGVTGKQNYNGTIKFIDAFYDGPSAEMRIRGSYESNFYSTWIGPDDDNDGVVDNAFQVGLFALDLTPSTTPFPGYFETWDLGDEGDGDGPNYVLISASVFSSLVLLSVGGSQVFQRVRDSKQIFQGDLQGKPREIIKEIFKSQTVLYYTLIGQNRIKDSEIENNLKEAIPKSIYDFKFLLHPIRLSMTKLLYENMELTSIDMKNILDVSWNDYTTHATALKNKKYISIDDQFVEGAKRNVLRLEPPGIEQYKLLTDLLHLFLDNSTDYQAYIETAQLKMEGMDPSLYPQD